MQEGEYTDEDRAFQEAIFGPAELESQIKESSEEQGVPEGKRRRTQEEKDWYDDLWTDADRTSKDIDSVERGEIEDRVIHWIQEVERVVEESMDHMEEIEIE
eukprot:11853964-Karenia_brevis.AAC.1